MVFQKITEVGNLYRVMEFHFSIEVGNLCRAGRTLEKNRTTPGTPPPPIKKGGANMLARQQLGVCELVERRANVRAIIELPAAYERIRERLHCVTVVRL